MSTRLIFRVRPVRLTIYNWLTSNASYDEHGKHIFTYCYCCSMHRNIFGVLVSYSRILQHNRVQWNTNRIFNSSERWYWNANVKVFEASIVEKEREGKLFDGECFNSISFRGEVRLKSSLINSEHFVCISKDGAVQHKTLDWNWNHQKSSSNSLALEANGSDPGWTERKWYSS